MGEENRRSGEAEMVGDVTFIPTRKGWLYLSVLSNHGMISSMSRKGNCWDNAVSESFFANLKNELTQDKNYPNSDQARAAIFSDIEIFYNRQRLHQTLNYVSPTEYELMNVA